MFKIEFSTDNAAFDDEYTGNTEIVRILTDITEKVASGSYDGTIFDINGNRIGLWEAD